MQIMDLHKVQCLTQLILLLLLAESQAFITNYANGGCLNMNEIHIQYEADFCKSVTIKECIKSINKPNICL